MDKTQVIIAAAQRTPIGAFQGVLAPATAPQLGAAAIAGAIARAGIAPADVQEVIMGCVLPAGLGQAPARQAALAAGLPAQVPATTVNKMCGSGMNAIMMAADQIRTGDVSIAVAGGLESMSNAPYLLPKARTGMRMGHGEVLDHMLFDGLQSPFDGQLMGCFADDTARKYAFSRADQDAFASESVRRALDAGKRRAFADEITPVTVKGRKGEVTVEADEKPFGVDVAKIPTLKPAFRKDGTVTAASSSSISDGASATVLLSAAEAQQRGVTVAGAYRGLHQLCAGTGMVHHRARGRHQQTTGAPWLEEHAMCIYTRSTKHSRWSPWRRCATSASITHASMSMVVRARWAIRSAPPAPASSPRWCMRCGRVAAGAASPRYASAAARPRPLPSRCRPEFHGWPRVRYAVRVPAPRRGLTP